MIIVPVKAAIVIYEDIFCFTLTTLSENINHLGKNKNPETNPHAQKIRRKVSFSEINISP